MKKKFLSVLLVVAMMLSLAACGNNNDGGNTPPATDAPTSAPSTPDPTKAPDATPTPTPSATPVPEPEADIWEQLTDGEMVDGKFTTTRKITVEIFNRETSGGTDVTDNKWTDYVKKGMLEDHNVEVEFVSVPRWTETEQLNNLLAAGEAPDVCYTYSYPTIQTYANMGAVHDLGTMVEDLKPVLPNLWNWLGDYNINYDKDPVTGELWAIEGKRADTKRIVTFIREDWLTKLNLPVPTTREEFYNTLVAFKDNADTLLGADAAKMIPFSVSTDVGWRAALLIESMMDPDISDKEYYINGFDDRKFLQNGTKDAVRLLNKWYNEGLLWKDFITATDNSEEDNNIKAGFVGAFQHNWDYAFRDQNNSIQANVAALGGKFIAIDCFEDKNGNYTKYSYDPSDRKVFFPIKNKEPLASIMYLDWISDPVHLQYLQLGEVGVNHEVLENGAYKAITAVAPDIMNSSMNIDMTMTCNGLNLPDANLTQLSQASGYAEVDPADVMTAIVVATNDTKVGAHVSVGAILAEDGVGEALNKKRDEGYGQAMKAPVDQFDAVWDQYQQEYLDMGGQAIIDERTEKWEQFYGDATMVQ